MTTKLYLSSAVVALLLFAGAGCTSSNQPSYKQPTTTSPTSTYSPDTQYTTNTVILNPETTPAVTSSGAMIPDGTKQANQGASQAPARTAVKQGAVRAPSRVSQSAQQKQVTVAGVSSDKAYLSALDIFDEKGYRYQFANCSGLPGIFTVKKNVQFMLDNRDAERHTLGIGGKDYVIPAYGYAIASVPTAGNYFITCDGGGAAQVRVQN